MLRTFLFASTVLVISSLSAQDQRTWLDQVLQPCGQKTATYYRVANGPSGGLFLASIHLLDGTLKAEGSYLDSELLIPHGRFTFYYASGQVESTGDYAMGSKSGLWERYDKVGMALAEKIYDPVPLSNIEHTLAKTMPAYPGGDGALVKAVRTRAGKQPNGTVASFVVERDGSVSDLKVRGTDEPSAEVIAAVIAEARWSVGNNDGLPVRVRMQVAVR